MAERLLSEWLAWNAIRRPENPGSFGETYKGAQLTDHIGLA
jgi:hypothetical protein